MEFSVKPKPVAIGLTLFLVLLAGLNAQTNLAPVITSPSFAEGTVNSTFSYTIRASRSPTNYNATGLPTGLNLNPQTAEIFGIPQSAGTFSVLLQATNSNGTGTAVLELVIQSRAPRFFTSGKAVGTVSEPFSLQAFATNNPTLYQAAGLPAGFIFNPSSVTVSGTPLTAGTITGTVAANNAFGSATLDLSINIEERTPVFTSSNYIRASRNAPLTYSITATRDPTTFSASGLPSGLTLNAQSGVISGTPSFVDTTTATLTARNGFGATEMEVTFEIVDRPPRLLSPARVAGRVNDPLTYAIVWENEVTRIEALNLPTGISLDPLAGILSGTPTRAFNTTTTLRLFNQFGSTEMALEFLIASQFSDVPVITSVTSAVVESGEPYSYQITATQDPTSYSAAGLPAGLDIDSNTGLVSGTLTNNDQHLFELFATNENGASSIRFQLTVVPPPAEPPALNSASSFSGAVGFPFSAQISGWRNPTHFDTDGLPRGLFLERSSGRIRGIPSLAGISEAQISLTNSAGSGLSTIEFTISETPPSIFSGFDDLGMGWKFKFWFGLLNETQYPWIFHDTLGYLYIYAIDTSNIWMFSPSGENGLGLGWIWTSETVYPHLYKDSPHGWLWYDKGSTNPAFFYNFNSEEWEAR